jgi:hypothetical protein
MTPTSNFSDSDSTLATQPQPAADMPQFPDAGKPVRVGTCPIHHTDLFAKQQADGTLATTKSGFCGCVYQTGTNQSLGRW